MSSSHFNIPFRVDIEVRDGQVICIFLGLININDIFTSTQTAFTARHAAKNAHDQGTGNQVKVKYIWLPNILKFVAAIVVAVVTLVVIVQSADIIELIMNFTALELISEVDNLLFNLASFNCLGKVLKGSTHTVKDDIKMEDVSLLWLQLCVLLFCLIAMVVVWAYYAIEQVKGSIFYEKYPKCFIPKEQIGKFGDGTCDGGFLNTIHCKFDGGDCIDFNMAYPDCKILDPSKVGDGNCDPELEGNSDCGYDGGDCCAKYTVQDGIMTEGCNAKFNSQKCLYDFGRCDKFNDDYKDCDKEYIAGALNKEEVSDVFPSIIIGRKEKQCDRSVMFEFASGTPVSYNSFACGYEDGECIGFNEKYPNCTAPEPLKVLESNGQCASSYRNAWDGCSVDSGDSFPCSRPPWSPSSGESLVGLFIIAAIVCCFLISCRKTRRSDDHRNNSLQELDSIEDGIIQRPEM